MMPNSITDQTQVQGLPNKVLQQKHCATMRMSKNALEFSWACFNICILNNFGLFAKICLL
jgi:hypothetical protein